MSKVIIFNDSSRLVERMREALEMEGHEIIGVAGTIDKLEQFINSLPLRNKER